MTVKTFHALGYEIMGKTEDRHPAVAKVAGTGSCWSRSRASWRGEPDFYLAEAGIYGTGGA